MLVVVLFRVSIANVDELDKLFILFLLVATAIFIAVTSIGAGGSLPPPPVNKSIILPIPRYNDIAATPSAAFTATAPTPSINRPLATNLPASIIACFCKDSNSSWTIQKPAPLVGKRTFIGWYTHNLPSLSTLLKQSIIAATVLNCISLLGLIPWIIVVSFASVTNALALSDLKLYSFYKVFNCILN